jgi:hypothetical protein
MESVLKMFNKHKYFLIVRTIRLLSIKGGKPLLPGSRGFFFLPVPDEIIKVAAVLFNQSALQF